MLRYALSDPMLVILATIAFILSVSAHEANHALVATALGDDTPRRAGRLTLNPFKHVSAMGILFFVLAGFGWGSTPITPAKLRPNPRTGYAIVSLAGPLANLALAIACALVLRAGIVTTPELARFLTIAASLNVLLFVFNLLPIPPLDGFAVLLGVLPRALALSLRKLERYGLGILFALLFLLPYLGVDPVGWILRNVTRALSPLGLH